MILGFQTSFQVLESRPKGPASITAVIENLQFASTQKLMNKTLRGPKRRPAALLNTAAVALRLKEARLSYLEPNSSIFLVSNR